MENTAQNIPRMTAEEYFRTIETADERTELYDGVPVSQAAPGRTHQRISSHLHHTIEDYIRRNNGSCEVDEALSAQLSEDTVVIPDVMTVCDPGKMDERGCHGAPDWVIEIVSANRKDDFIYKLALYQDAGVREYWVVDPKNQKTLVYFFEQSDFPVIYTFDTEIPVGIYAGMLKIKIADML